MKFLYTGTLILFVLYGFAQDPDKFDVQQMPIDLVRPARSRSCTDANGDINILGLFKARWWYKSTTNSPCANRSAYPAISELMPSPELELHQINIPEQ
jgi:hypothetical protein